MTEELKLCSKLLPLIPDTNICQQFVSISTYDPAAALGYLKFVYGEQWCNSVSGEKRTRKRRARMPTSIENTSKR